jgi:trimeric autotransporter adhesin
MKKVYLLLLFHLVSLWSFAQIPGLIKDMNTIGNYYPSGYCLVGNIVYFKHTDGVHGIELWRTDGTNSGTYMVKDINIGAESSQVISNRVDLVNHNGILFFKAYTPEFGSELWKSDGTAAGTVMVKDIRSGALDSNIENLTSYGDYLIFNAFYSGSGQAIYQSNGTLFGTSVLKDVSNGSSSSNIFEIYKADFFPTGAVFFVVLSSSAGLAGIWSTNVGLFTNTLSIPSKIPNTEGANNLFFLANTTTNSYDLFFYKNINSFNKYNLSTGAINPLLTFNCTIASNLIKPISLNNQVFFKGCANTSQGWEIFKTDGTSSGTLILKDINVPSMSDSNVDNFTFYENHVYFSANDGINGNELWKTNGTTAGTTLVNDIVPGIGDSNPFGFIVNNGNLFFRNFAPNPIDYEITVRKYSDVSNTLSSIISLPAAEGVGYEMLFLNQTLLFTGFSETTGYEVWSSDGTAGNTNIIKDLDRGESKIFNFLTIGPNTFFSTNSNNYYNTLWKTNGTTIGTSDLSSFFLISVSNNTTFANLNGALILTATNQGYDYELYKSDGINITLLKNISFSSSSFPSNFTLVNNILYFTANDHNGTGQELWKSDGTSAGTVLVKDIYPGLTGSMPENLFNFNGTLYFSAITATHGRELWKSDGSAAGTVLVSDIYLGTASSNPKNFVAHNNKLYFSAYLPTIGEELWEYNGTNTNLIKDIYLGNPGSNISEIVSNGNKMFFSADNGVIGQELWISDGTTAGTNFRNLNPDGALINSSSPANFTVLNGTVYFSADYFNVNLLPAHPYLGRELWRSDGGLFTYLIKDINQNINSINGILPSFKGPFETIGNSLFFPATDGVHGIELWRSDGTSAGTHMAIDLFSGPDDGLSSAAVVHTDPLNSKVYFEGTDGQNGRELWGFTYCPTTLSINFVINSNGQKQQASQTIVSSSTITSTPFDYGNLDINYRAGKAITLLPGFSVEGNKLPQNRKTVFKAEISNCSN